MPLIWLVMVVVMARPAASSLAPLMRRPVESRSMATPAILDAEVEALDARIALIFVLMTAMIPILHYGPRRVDRLCPESQYGSPATDLSVQR